MTTPNTSIAPLALSDINKELSYAANTARSFNDGIFRNLTGVQGRTVPNSPIALSDLSSKTAFGGIISADSATISSFGVLEQSISLVANTDMYSPDVAWSAIVVSGTPGVLTQNGKTATYKLTGSQQQTVSANVQVTATLSYGGHVIGTASKYISIVVQSNDPALVVSGNTNSNVFSFEPTTAQTSLQASSNVANGVIRFTVTPNDAGVMVSGNTVTFVSRASISGTDNNRSYAVTTDLLFNNQVIASDIQNINVRAAYQIADFVFTVPATTNNNFANTGTVRSSIKMTAEHAIPGANLVWAAAKVSGDDATLTIAPDLGSANLHINVASGVFGTKKSIYDVTATLQYSNGQVINAKTARLTLRTGAYGLSFTPAANVSAVGYTAQTALATARATYQAGTLSWDIARVSGDVASIANTVVAGSGSADLSVSGTATANAVYRINPVLTFDGVVMANVSSQTTLYYQVLPYTFGVSGPTSNTVLAAAPANASLTTTATHNIANGSIVWTKAASPSTLNANGNVAVTSFSTNTIGSDTVALTAELRDDQNRLVERKNVTLTLRAFDPAVQWAGANSVSSISYTDQNLTATVNATARAGADSFSVVATKLQGATLVINSPIGNTTFDRTDLTSVQTTPGTSEGLYRLTANTTWFGVSKTDTYDVSVSATKLDANFTLTGSNAAVSDFNFPVVADATVVASHTVPGGTITWSRTVNSGQLTVLTANNTHYVQRNSQSSVGTLAGNATVTAVLRDSAGNFVDQKSVTVTSSATRNDPALALTGANSSVSNTFHATASSVVTPSVNPALVGHAFQFTWTPVAGSATVTANSSAVSLSNTFDGIGTASGTYDVKADVLLNGQTIATSTKRVLVEAICPAPVLNISGTNDTESDFNYPVVATARAVANSTPAGAVVSWTWAKIAGSALTITTDLGNSRINVAASQSNVGTLSGTYDVTATYRTPNGTLLGTKTTRVVASSERLDPQLTWVMDTIAANTVTGFANTLTSAVTMHATVNPALTGHTYRITKTFVSGNSDTASLSTSNAAGTATSTMTNNRVTNGTAERTATYDISIDVMLNAQAITGKLVQRISHDIIPGVVTDIGDISASRNVWTGTATASLSFSPDGTASFTGLGTQTRRWMTPSDTTEAAKYQISFNGTTWQDLNVVRSISVSASSPSGYDEASGTYSIRVKATGTVVASNTYFLSAAAGTQV